MTIQTFSGMHPFRPQCLIDAYVKSVDPFEPEEEPAVRADAASEVANLLETMEDRRCLRCAAKFDKGEVPSGSRATECRCIPVCRVCGEAEAYQWDALARIKGPDDAVLVPLIAPVCNWPVSSSQTAEAVAAFRERYGKIASLPLDAIDLSERPHSGGWAEHGYDDSADREERHGR